MNIGLLYTPVSIYQMTRGALVLFVGILSVVFLRRRLWFYQLSIPRYLRKLYSHPIYRWFSLLTVMAGIALVGLSGSLIQDTAKNSLLAEEPPEATTVLLGKFTFHYYFRTRAELYQACSSFYSLRSCRSPTHTLRASRS